MIALLKNIWHVYLMEDNCCIYIFKHITVYGTFLSNLSKAELALLMVTQIQKSM